MSSDDFSSLHDVYDGLKVNENHVRHAVSVERLDFRLRCYRPLFHMPFTIETRFLHSIVTRTMLAFTQFNFSVRAVLCDGASTNLSLMKLLCGHSNDMDTITPWFMSPFDGQTVFLIVCPSYQVRTV